MENCYLIEKCTVAYCLEKATHHLITVGRKYKRCRAHYCDKHFPEMKPNFYQAARKGEWIEEKKTEKYIENHKDHPQCRFFSSKVGLYVSPNGKIAELIDFSLEKIGERHLKFRDGKRIVQLPCNLSNHGCKEIRRVTVQVKIFKIWKPKRKVD